MGFLRIFARFSVFLHDFQHCANFFGWFRNVPALIRNTPKHSSEINLANNNRQYTHTIKHTLPLISSTDNISKTILNKHKAIHSTTRIVATTPPPSQRFFPSLGVFMGGCEQSHATAYIARDILNAAGFSTNTAMMNHAIKQGTPVMEMLRCTWMCDQPPLRHLHDIQSVFKYAYSESVNYYGIMAHLLPK